MPIPAWLDWIPAQVLRWLGRVTAPVLRPSRNAVRGWALASVIVNAVAIATGAAVRLSGSGLGCPDWPACTKSSLVAAQSTGQTLLNSWIEFGNRLLVVSLTVIAAATFIAFVMYKTGGQRRTDLIWLSAIQPLVVVAQAVVGGITVLTKLPPALVSTHFLLSALILLPAAVVLHVRTGEGPGRHGTSSARTFACWPASWSSPLARCCPPGRSSPGPARWRAPRSTRTGT